MASEETSNIEIKPANKEKIRGIWKVALYLAIITAIEFVFAFTMDAGFLRTSIFIFLTIVKAFFIVSEFMHLGHEKKSLVYAIILPMVFLVWLLVVLLKEGSYIFDIGF